MMFWSSVASLNYFLPKLYKPSQKLSYQNQKVEEYNPL